LWLDVQVSLLIETQLHSQLVFKFASGQNIRVMNYSNSSNQPTNFSAKDCSLPVSHGIALIATNSVVGLLGTLGNLLVCAAVVTSPRLRRCSNYLLVSLAIADLFATTICEPLFLEILAKRTFFNDCAWNMERIYFFISNFSAAASVVHMSAISVDRFIAIVFPLRHKSTMEGFGIKAMLTASWTFTIALFLLGKFLPAPVQIKAFANLAIFVLCYLIVFVSYTLIVISLVRQKKKRNEISAPTSNDANSRFEARVAFTLAIVIVVFTACWFPLFVVFAATGRPLVKVYGNAHYWIRTVALSNSAMNFLIYGSRMRNFSDTYVSIFRKILGSARISLFKPRRVHALPAGRSEGMHLGRG